MSVLGAWSALCMMRNGVELPSRLKRPTTRALIERFGFELLQHNGLINPFTDHTTPWAL